MDLRLPPGSGGDGDTEGGTDADDPNAPLPPPPEEPDDDGRDPLPPDGSDPDGRDDPPPLPMPGDPNPNPDGRDEPPPDPGPSDPNPNPDGRLVLQIPPAASIEDAGIFLRYPGQWEHAVFRSQTTDGVFYNVHRWYEPGAGRYNRKDPLRDEQALPYAYGVSNPLFWVDWLGLQACEALRGLDIPPSPSDVDIEENMEEAAEHSHNLLWLIERVRSDGEWDFKTQGPEFEDFGNFHYGAVFCAADIPPALTAWGAGFYQILSGTSQFSWIFPLGFGSWQTPTFMFPFGDDPVDQAQIFGGISFCKQWKKCCR